MTVSGEAPAGSGLSACSVSTRVMVVVVWFLKPPRATASVPSAPVAAGTAGLEFFLIA